ncbi:excinuclease ABC subunit UvrA [Bittarella massiliensis (ex Durand et al. 2017)]|uniref:UvrABC system protein A n=1 Tax=Bittarella massiliensis (ex Durand et al. 2017) TaxID=1720313 RepID=A0AAW5KCT0_9FIRM|nr:excinuclease ABC subunit UvrA [Bittarella massiliensis (ex Durand et al. 2017)]
MRPISILNATEGNLQNLSLDIPREKLVVLTGPSGAGKSTLAVDLLHRECQRQYLEAMALQGIAKPGVERVSGTCPAVLIAPRTSTAGPRSTLGTATGIYTDLRMLFEKLACQPCPHCGQTIRPALYPQEVERVGDEYHSSLLCPHCGQRVRLLGRIDYSHNTEAGACEGCRGLGVSLQPDLGRLLREDRALEEGAVAPWEGRYGEYQAQRFGRAAQRLHIPLKEGTPLSAYTPRQRALLLEGDGKGGDFEGVLPNLWRRYAEKKGAASRLEGYFTRQTCPVCGGERLKSAPRRATLGGMRLPQLAGLSLARLAGWLAALGGQLEGPERALAAPYLRDLGTKLGRLERMGLGYLTLERPSATLSGGEGQRVRLAAALDAEITGILYILDEPTAGLHPADTAGLIAALRELRDRGNTVLVIEHDLEVMAAADWVIDLGPGAGRRGGRLCGAGPLERLRGIEGSPTGRWLRAAHGPPPARRTPAGALRLSGATSHNLQGLTVDFPLGCLTAVTGVSGSGKTSLVFASLWAALEGDASAGRLSGSRPGRVVAVGQEPLARSRRSCAATYAGVFAPIRALFAAQPAAREAGLTAADFSFNSPGGRCEHCQGLGEVSSNLLFFEDLQLPCPVCGGRRFSPPVLAVRCRGRDISQVLELSVDEGAALFADLPAIAGPLGLLSEAGLGYLPLGQPSSALSGGECQRLKLACQLWEGRGETALYLIDEPTAGLHPADVDGFLRLLTRLVEGGSTAVVVEHDLQFIAACDWVIDLGPGGGEEGGRLVAAGTPEEVARTPASLTGRHLAPFLRGMGLPATK